MIFHDSDFPFQKIPNETPKNSVLISDLVLPYLSPLVDVPFPQSDPGPIVQVPDHHATPEVQLDSNSSSSLPNSSYSSPQFLDNTSSIPLRRSIRNR